MRRALSVAGGLLAATALAACDTTVGGSPTAGRQAGTTPPTSAGPSATAPRTTSPPQPKPSKTRPPAPAPTAADGRNVAACADGTCEIALTRPINVPLGQHGSAKLLKVTRVSAKGIRFSVTTDGGEASGNLNSGGCMITLYSGGMRSQCGPDVQLHRVDPGEFSMQVISASHAGVILRMMSG